MPESKRYFRLIIRNAADDGDELVLSSFPDDDFPFVIEEPTGDGQSIDVITGAATTGAYTFQVVDETIATNTRVITAKLADARARQQLLYRRAFGKTSEDGTTWDTLITGYITAARMIDAITFEFGVGQSRRREVSKEIFKNSSSLFPGVTCVIGGPVIGGFADMLEDHGGWTFEVTAKNSSPPWVKLELDTNGGFDPRKSPTTTFSTVSSAIADFTNDWARSYFEPSDIWRSDDIQGHFPKLEARLIPVGGTDADAITLNPLSFPVPVLGGIFGAFLATIADSLITSPDGILHLPKDALDVNGDPVVFDPTVGDKFEIWIYAIPVSEDNPLHLFLHPVDLWEDAMQDAGYIAGVDYDDTNLATLKTDLNAWAGGDVRLALRITQSYKLTDFLRSVVYGPFRLSTRFDDGLLTLFSTRIGGRSTPSDTYTVDDLKSLDGTPFDTDESTTITAITLKQQRLRPWTTDEKDQPAVDALLTLPWPTDTLENSDDDIPTGAENTVTIGNIPGMIMTDDGTNVIPLPFDQFLAILADEFFDIFGRGGIFGDFHFLPEMTKKVGEDFYADMIHRPNAVVGQSPVSQRGGARRVMVVHRTEESDGPVVRLLDCEVDTTTIGPPGDDGTGGTEDETDVTAAIPPDPVLFDRAPFAFARWSNKYPQFDVHLEYESHPPSETTFSLMYGGAHDLSPNTTGFPQHAQTGYTVRCRLKYTDGLLSSAWSNYSNEVEISDPFTVPPPEVPVDVPTDLVATSVVNETGHAEWVNTNMDLQLWMEWRASIDTGTPASWRTVAGGTRIVDFNISSDDQLMGTRATFGSFRLAYMNTGGVLGPLTDWSDAVAIS
jgi:hypothetical protein